MQIINSASSQKETPYNTTKLENSMEKFNKYLDSNLLKYLPQSYDANGATVTTAVKNAVSISTETTPLRQIEGQTSPVVSPSPLEQYRLQLYNYALNIDRLRCTQHNTTAAYASSAVPGLHLVINGENNRHFGSIDMKMESNYTCPTISNVRPYVPVALAHGNRLDLSMSLFPQRMFRTEEPKPQYSYIGLIAMAILSSAETKLVLSDIYQHILDNYPYFRARGPGWRNSIRHNLSLNDCFIKSGRSANGKGHYWAIHPANIDDFRRGDFRRRKAQRKVRKHMGLSIDDASTDSPSPPPLDLTATQLTATRLLRVAPPGNSLNATHDFDTPNALSFSCLHPLLQMPSSFSLQQAQQQIQDSYFGTAIMEQYTCMPSVPAYSNGYSSSLQQEYYKFSHNGQLDNIQTNDNIMPLCPEQSISDNHAKNSKHSLFNGTAITTVAPHTIRDAKSNYYTHMHKRQFDVASLLAPDRKLFTTTFRDKEQQTPTFDALEHTQILKKNLEEHGKQHLQQIVHDDTQVTHSAHKSLITLPVAQTRKLTPLAVEYECEQEQDEIDVVANDNDEHSKESFSCNADNENAVHQQVFGTNEKSDCVANNGRPIYDYSDNANTTPHRRTNAIHHHPTIPNAVIEWRMVQQQPLSVEKLIKKFGAGNTTTCSATNNTIGFEDCFARKITSTTNVNPILNTKSLTMENTSELNHTNCKNQIELCEHEPNSITINAAAHKSLHVRRIIQHLHQQQQQQQQQIQETLKEPVDDKDSAFSRHYSTYITAAATRHIGPLQLKQIQCQQQKCDIISKRR